MSALSEDNTEETNAPELSVSEISAALKRMVETSFAHVRVRAEIGRVSRPSSGHIYLDLKDDRAVLSGVIWKGVVGRLQTVPEEGMEVIATGRLTTFGGQSKYQIVIEAVSLAGTGALMALLEKRRKAFAAEGLFSAERKKPCPYLPRRIGVITSPSGAVIRDILHRLRDRFPCEVLIWPVAVQGARSADEVARAVSGFNRLSETPQKGSLMRPDLLIIARGGGSIEDLWSFNEEAVIRAVADSSIPVISAIGHETDTTLVDYVADIRAPTPTAAAEFAVPVRLDLVAGLDDLGLRMVRSLTNSVKRLRQRLNDFTRLLGQPEQFLTPLSQRLDLWSERLSQALRNALHMQRVRFERASIRIRPKSAKEHIARQCQSLDQLGRRLKEGCQRQIETLSSRLTQLERLRQSVGYQATLKRGYAVIRDGRAVITSKDKAKRAKVLQIEFQDGCISFDSKAPTKTSPTKTIPNDSKAKKKTNLKSQKTEAQQDLFSKEKT